MGYIGVTLGLYWDTGKENGNYIMGYIRIWSLGFGGLMDRQTERAMDTGIMQWSDGVRETQLYPDSLLSSFTQNLDQIITDGIFVVNAFLSHKV